MLGIIIAMQDECCNLMKKTFKDVFVQTIQNKKFYIVTTKNNQTAIICFSGIGKVNAALSTSLMINNFNLKNIINIGSCGILKNLEVNDLLIVDKTMYSDVDVTAFGYNINQVPKMPTEYQLDIKLNQWLKSWLTMTQWPSKMGLCMTSDSFINNQNFNKFNFIDSSLPTVIDMECCAIAQVCHELKVNFNAIKIGVDKLFEPITNQEQFNNNLVMIAKKIDMIVNNIIDSYNYDFLERKE